MPRALHPSGHGPGIPGSLGWLGEGGAPLQGLLQSGIRCWGLDFCGKADKLCIPEARKAPVTPLE